MKSLLSVLAIILIGAVSASAQSESHLKQFFEGRHVILKIDMPATKDGVNVYPERSRPLNYSEYAAKIRHFGTAIRAGERIMVTKVKVKGKHIEFQLGGGGYGTMGDETVAAVYVPRTEKSKREKRLEEAIKNETDPQKKRQLKDELNDLRRERQREDQRNQAIAAELEELKRQRIEQKALQAGSRFNIHYERVVSSDALTPEGVMRALGQYADFSEFVDDSSSYLNHSLRPKSPTIFLKNGLSTREVLSVLGAPTETSERMEGNLRVSTYRFSRRSGHVVEAEFVDGVLVRSNLRPGETPQRAVVMLTN